MKIIKINVDITIPNNQNDPLYLQRCMAGGRDSLDRIEACGIFGVGWSCFLIPSSVGMSTGD